VNFRMRVGRSIELIPVLVAIGVTERGHKVCRLGTKSLHPPGGSFSRI
jgi:hypothetical protein